MKRKIFRLIMLLSLTIITYSAVLVLKWQKDNQEQIKILENLKSYKYVDTSILKENKSLIDFAKLQKENIDTVGWIHIANTQVDYPIVQSDDNNYYLNHAFNKTENASGAIFVDYRNNLEKLNKNTIIYGHACNNGLMFGSLKEILNNSTPPIIEIYTPTYNSKWQIFSAYYISKESYYLTTKFINTLSYQQFKEKITKRSLNNYHQDLTNINNILTLSTCKDNFSHRLVIHAKLIEKETL